MLNSCRILLSTLFFFPLYCLLVTSGLPAYGEDVWFNDVFDTGVYNMSIIQDRQGFLWLTTSNGLVRYDGYEKKIIKKGPDGLTSNLVPCVYEDSEGLLWIVTLSGLDLYDRRNGSFRHFQHDPANSTSIGSNNFNWAPKLVAEDKNGLIWIGTKEGLYSFNKQTEKFTAYHLGPKNDPHGLNADNVWTVVADRGGSIWVGTSAGLDVYDPGDNQFSHFLHDPEDDGGPQAPGKGIVYAVAQGRDGDVWVGTSEGGLSRYSRSNKTFTHYRHDPNDPDSLACDEIFSITEDSRGNLWLGRSFSRAFGLEKYNMDSGKFTLYKHDSDVPGSLYSNIILTCFEDRSGILWVPENTGKVQKMDPYCNRFKLHTVKKNDSSTTGLRALTSVYEDSRGDIWTGGQQGLSRFDRKSQTWTYFAPDPDNPQALWNQYAFSMIEDSDGNFWVATDDGILNLFDRDRGIVLKRYQNPIIPKTARMIVEDRFDPDIFWFGIENYGLFKFNKKSGEFTRYESRSDASEGLLDGFIVSLRQDDDGRMWIQSHSGLYHFNPRTEKFIRYSHNDNDPASISSNVINDLYIDIQGVFWVSTDSGLNRFDPQNGRFLRYGKKHGFPTMSTRTILEDRSGLLWIGSDAGLIVFDPAEEKVTRVYTKEDGLQCNSFSLYATSALQTRGGRMWFAGPNGVNSFYPEKIRTNPFKPSVYLNTLTQGGEEIISNPSASKGTDVDLDWRHNFFEFTYAALNYSQPGNNLYKYILEGWDKDWFYAGKQRSGRYSGLSGGDYTLKILAANNDGLWSDSPFFIRIHVATPFWQTWWFYLLCISSMLFILFLLFFIRTRNLQQFNRKLEAAYKLVKLAEEKYRSIFENATEGIFQSTPEGKLLTVNTEMARILGYESSEELIGAIDNISQQVYVDAADREKLIRALKENSVISNFETRFRRKDNLIIWVNISVRKNDSEKEGRVSFDGIVKDITRRREIEIELENHRQNLENMVAERTKKINEANILLQHEIDERHRVEEELLKSKKLESIGVLAGGIAHDFNNLLAVIVGRISMAQLHLIPGSKAAEELEKAELATERAAELSNKFITFSSGGKPVKELDDIGEVVRNTVELSLSGSKVKAKFLLSPDLWPVSIDRNQMSQAFNNIIENAKNAMDKGGVLQVMGENFVFDQEQNGSKLPLSTGDYVMICFQDEGGGIPKEYLSRIFDPYFTMDAMGKEKGKGLGLSITYSIINKHNGYIFVDSREGKGASVYVYLPALPEQSLSDPPFRLDDSGKGKKILVMDDEEMIRATSQNILEIMGHEVFVAPEGESAFTLYEQAYNEGRPFDLLIIDLTIPGGLGGKELITKLIQFDPNVRAIVSSGYAEDPVMSNYQDYGFVQALPKPYTLERMQAVLDEVFVR